MRDRGRRSRNLIQLLTMIALAGIGMAQLMFGPEGSPVILTMPRSTQLMFAALLMLAAVAVLLGAALPEPRAHWIELAGQVGCAIALTVYSFTLKDTLPSWNTSLGTGYAFTAVGCALRACQLAVLIAVNFYPGLWARVRRRR